MKLKSSLFLLPTAALLSSLLIARVASPASSSYERRALTLRLAAEEQSAPSSSNLDARSELAPTSAVETQTPEGVDIDAHLEAPTMSFSVPAPPIEELESHPPLRRLLKKETTRAIAKQARAIIDTHAAEPIGTEVPFQADGEAYVARIEVHYHPPGGEKRPWGEHPGVSVFVARPWP